MTLGAILLPACEAALDVRVVLDRDGAGSLGVSLSADEELLARAAAAGADPIAALAASARALEGWAVVEEALPATAGGGRRVQLSTVVDGPEELERRSAELADALSAPEVDLLDGFQVELDDDTVRLEGRAGLVPTSATTEIGLRPEDAVRLLEEHDAFRYTVHARMPGAVLESNAGSAPAEDGPTELVWRIAPGTSVALSAVGERPGPSALLLAAGAVSAALLLLAGVLLLRPRRT